MKVDDTNLFYDILDITDEAVLELIESPTFQRLKGVHQLGCTYLVIPKRSHTRYEHSIGTYLLLQKMGASREEQIAGLLHDVPHTAFSHVVDFVYKHHTTHDFHEKHQENIIKSSELGEILEKHGFSVDSIIDENNFPLLEQSSPDLCADRLDYIFRYIMEAWGAEKDVKNYISHLIVKNDEIVFDSPKYALGFAKDFLKIDNSCMASPNEVAYFQIMADAMRVALDDKILTEEELWKEDDYVYSLLEHSGNPLILEKLSMLNPNLVIEVNNDDFDFYSKTKPRYVNPKCPDKRVSEIYHELQTQIDNHVRIVKAGYNIKIVSF